MGPNSDRTSQSSKVKNWCRLGSALLQQCRFCPFVPRGQRPGTKGAGCPERLKTQVPELHSTQTPLNLPGGKGLCTLWRAGD